MGGGSFTAKDWEAYASSSVTGKSTREIYKSRRMPEEFDPKGVTRESRDSDEHPESTPIIIGLDVTGSMDEILHQVAEQLGDLVNEILQREPVKDPQIMFNAIGDSDCDDCPFQTTQFESDIRIAKQLTELYFEEGGGGNQFESYPLAWYFAANHTSCDNFEKRGKKGFLFTLGDDSFPKYLSREEIKRIFGEDIEKDAMPIQEVLSQVERKWEVFHLMLEQGWCMQNNRYPKEEWTRLLGERAIKVSDYTKIPQIIVSLLESMAGKDLDEIADSWDGSTAVVVREALKGLAPKKETSELVEF